MHIIKEVTSFEVPAEKDEEFLKGWNEIAEWMRHAPGVISIQLQESLDPATKFRFVAITEWESPLLYESANRQASKLFEDLRRKMPFAAYQGLYRIIVSAVASLHQ